VYNTGELGQVSPQRAFDRSWDIKAGVHTRQLLTVPIYDASQALTGVIQLANKKGEPLQAD